MPGAIPRVYKLENRPVHVLEGSLKKFKKEFLSAQQAIDFAKTSFDNDALEEVLVEECGSKACFNLMKFSANRDVSINDENL